MSLPWERTPETEKTELQPIPVEYQLPPGDNTEKVAPTRPTPAQSAQQADFSDAIGQAASEAFEQLQPWLQKQAIEYAKDYALGKVLGRQVDGFPTIKSVNKEGHEVVVADARNRSLRTFVQGLGVDLLIAFVGLLSMVANMDIFDKTAWVTFAVLVVKTLLTTVVSYVSRLKISPGGKIEGEPVKFLSVPVPKAT